MDVAKMDAAKIVADDFSCGPLRPDALETVWQGGGLTVRRPPSQAGEATGQAVGRADDEQGAASAVAAATPSAFRGAQGWLAALGAMRGAWGQDSQRHVHFKLYRVEPRGGQVATVIDYQAAAQATSGSVQQNATWRCRWRQPASGGPPQLVSVEVTDYEEVASAAAGGTMFSDCTVAAIGKNPSFARQLKHGLNHWARRIETIYSISLDVRYGMALGDFNGDDLDDLYVCQPGALPNRLFLHEPDGTLADRAEASGTDWLDHTASALVIDLDNDGDQDLVLATYARVIVMENDGQAHFQVKAVLPLRDWDVQSLSAADYDQDGYLDFFVCVGRPGQRPTGVGFVFHDARDGGANILFRNDIGRSDIGRSDGKWKFTDVTAQVGLDKENFRHSLAAAWEDYDDDGDLDLCIANDYGPKQLFRNDGGKFADVAAEAGAQDFGSGMSVSWGDYDRDGRMDLYLGNMFSSAGNRIAFQDKYLAQADQATRAIYQRFAKGNTLLRNLGGGKFQEVENAGVERGRWAWSSLLADINNDGRDDVLVANGFITGEDSSDL
jgi:hypothetical protein